MNLVLDTNILVSALWSPGRKAGDVVQAVLCGRLTACYDHRILAEYARVLRLPRLGFLPWEVDALLEPIIRQGLSVVPYPLPDLPFPDESDRKFFEVAHFCAAPLVTGNLKHDPDDPLVLSLSEFHEKYL